MSKGSGNKVDPYKAPSLSVTFPPNLWQNWDESRGAWRDRQRHTHPLLMSNTCKLRGVIVIEFGDLPTKWWMLCNHPINAERDRQKHHL